MCKQWCLLIAIIGVSMLLTSCGDTKARKPLAEASLQDMTAVPGGAYQMGSQQYQGYSKSVTLKSFYISKYNVSWKKYDLYSNAIGHSLLDQEDLKYHDFTRSPNHPVNHLSWYQANDYCQYLGKLTGLPYDLPTEAQWEYVARNNGNPNWLFPTNNGQQELGKNFPDETQLSGQKGNTSGGDFALPIGSIPCTPQGVCGLTGAVDQWMKHGHNGKKAIRGAGVEKNSVSYMNVFSVAYEKPDEQWAGFRCVINSDKSMAELKAIAEKHLP